MIGAKAAFASGPIVAFGADWSGLRTVQSAPLRIRVD